MSILRVFSLKTVCVTVIEQKRTSSSCVSVNWILGIPVSLQWICISFSGEGGSRSVSETSRPIDLMQTYAHLYPFIEASKDIQPNREILAPPGVDTEQDKEQVLSIGKHPSLIKVIHKQHSVFKPECWCFWNIFETFSDDNVQIHHRKFFRNPSSVIFWIIVFFLLIFIF